MLSRIASLQVTDEPGAVVDICGALWSLVPQDRRRVALDRAAWLAGRGYAAEVVRAFDASVSPRNVAVVARAAG